MEQAQVEPTLVEALSWWVSTSHWMHQVFKTPIIRIGWVEGVEG